jgi:hypothetical protein
MSTGKHPMSKRMGLERALVALAILSAALTACRGPTPATPSPFAPGPPILTPAGTLPDHLDDRPLCGLVLSETRSPWRPYWRSFYGQGGVSALLREGDWLWVGTPQGLARLDLESLDCTLLERTGTDPDVSLAGVHALVRDPEGCLWAASNGGVARYCAGASGDGRGWQPMPIDLFVSQLAFDADGNLWVFSIGRFGWSAYRYAGHEPPADGEWEGESVPYGSVPKDDCDHWFSKSYDDRFQSPAECRALAAWRQRLDVQALPAGLQLLETRYPLAVSGEGVWLFAQEYRPGLLALLHLTDKDKWSVMSWPFAYSALMVADETRAGVWTGSPDGLILSDGRTVQRMLLSPADLAPTGPAVFDMARDRAGRLWAATEQGLFRLDEGVERWWPTEIGENVLIAPDDQGGLWAVSRFGGGQVSHFDGERWQHQSGLWQCSPRDIAADVGGGLWMTAPGCDLLGFDGQQWAPYGGGFDVQGALLGRGPGGELYAALRDDRIQRYDGTTWEILPAPEEHRYALVEALAVDRRGGLWLGFPTSPYLRYFDGSRWHEFTGSVTLPVFALFIDSRGWVWVGGEGALLRYDGEGWESIPTGDLIVALGEDRQGRIWAGGPGGLYIYDPAWSGNGG